MGCWHGTCAVSNLPIFSGEPIRLMLLGISPLTDERYEESPNWVTGFCYASDRAFPVTPFMSGRYDDYGGIELDPPGPAVTACLEEIGLSPADSDNWVSILRGNAKDKPAPIFRFFGRDHLIGMMMIREDVFQHMLAEVHYETSWGDRPIITHKHLRALADAAFTECAALREEGRRAKESGDEEEREEFHFRERMMRYNTEESLLRHWQNHPAQMHSGLTRLSAASDAFIFDSMDEETFRDFLYAIADIMRFDNALTAVRKHYGVQSGAGSQSENLRAAASLARFIVKRAEELEHRYDEDDEDGDGDEGTSSA